MIEISENIAKDISADFLRVDLYNIRGKIYFGEITFYPGGGLEEFVPSIWDLELGNWLNISK